MADMPIPGDGFTDARGRVMHVHEVNPGDPLGREVVGTRSVTVGEGLARMLVLTPYACTLATWAAVWRDKAPPLPAEQMKIG